MNLKNIITEINQDNKTILIRSKVDDKFRFDFTYDNNDTIISVETQGDTSTKMNNKDWLNLFIKFTTRSKVDFDDLREILAKIPELYVKDIV
jgi:hypothetical protein